MGVGNVVAELLLDAVFGFVLLWEVGAIVVVELLPGNVVVFPWGVGAWEVYGGCGQGSGVSIKPCSVPGFGVPVFCAAGKEGTFIPILMWVDREF